MSWLSKLVLIAYIVLCLGPLRPMFWSNDRWRFCLPGSVAGWIAYAIAVSARHPHEPWWVATAVGVFVGLGAGAAAKRWIDQELGTGGPQ